MLPCFVLTYLCIALLPADLFGGVIYAEQLSVREVAVGNFLKWTTRTEVQNRRFRIQKSVNGLDFITIAEVEGHGTAEGPFTYRYLDPAIGGQEVWYRLAQEDFDGTLTISHTVRLVRRLPNSMLITAMSHTVTDRYFSMTVLSEQAGTATLLLTDAKDQPVWQRPQPLRKGEQVIVVDMEPWPEGIYRLELKLGREEEAVTVVKAPPGAAPRVNVAVKN